MKKSTGLLFTLVLGLQASAQITIATLDVSPSSDISNPVSIDLDAITALPDSALYIIEVQGREKKEIPFQIVKKKHRELHWIIASGNKKRTYQLINGKSPLIKSQRLKLTEHQGTLRVQANEKNLLQYNFETVLPPSGVDSAFKRSGFIHPLWSPGGQVLTRIQPPDHYHHYGIWNPWTHLLYNGDTLDFWNLYKKQGTVRFAKFIHQKTGSVFAEYAALHEHVAFTKSKDEVILNEIQTVRTYQPDTEKYYVIDITIEYTCATQNPVRLLEYRYGGLGWRATEQWTNTNSTVLTSEGKTRKDADGTKARWCLVQGAIDNAHAGILMMSDPSNYNHPEPLRIWPENQYERGDMFANFDPTKDKDWLLEPGKTYILKYRFVVFNNLFNKEKAEEAWSAFANPHKMNVTINK